MDGIRNYGSRICYVAIMATKHNELWIEWFDKQTADDKRAIALAAVEHLMEIGEVRFRVDDSANIDGTPIPEDEVVDECLYWSSCGEDLRIPF